MHLYVHAHHHGYQLVSAWLAIGEPGWRRRATRVLTEPLVPSDLVTTAADAEGRADAPAPGRTASG